MNQQSVIDRVTAQLESAGYAVTIEPLAYSKKIWLSAVYRGTNAFLDKYIWGTIGVRGAVSFKFTAWMYETRIESEHMVKIAL